MAIYHFSVQVISRSRGKSAIASASYRSAEKLHDERIGETFDYTRKQNVSATEIHAPDHAPDWVRDRGRLWNAVEQIEKRKDAQLAREINLALPTELKTEQNRALVQKFVRDNFVSKGMIADVAYHDLESHNPHAHVMLTTREIKADGFGKKNREWNQKPLLQQWREEWAKTTNKALEIAGTQERIDHRSLEAQKINRLPQIHVGVHAHAMAKKGLGSERHSRNESIKVINFEKARLEKEEKQLQKLLEKPMPADQRTALNDRLKEIRNQVPGEPKNNAPKQRTYADVMKEHSQLEQKYAHAQREYGERAEMLHKLRRDFKEVKQHIGSHNQSVKRINDLENKLKQISPLNPFKRAERKKLKSEYDREKSHFDRIRQQRDPIKLGQLHDRLATEIQAEEKTVAGLSALRDQRRQQFLPIERERQGWLRNLDFERAKDALAKFERGEKLDLPEAKNLLKFKDHLQLDTVATKAIRGIVRVLDQQMDRGR